MYWPGLKWKNWIEDDLKQAKINDVKVKKKVVNTLPTLCSQLQDNEQKPQFFLSLSYVLASPYLNIISIFYIIDKNNERTDILKKWDPRIDWPELILINWSAGNCNLLVCQ